MIPRSHANGGPDAARSRAIPPVGLAGIQGGLQGRGRGWSSPRPRRIDGEALAAMWLGAVVVLVGFAIVSAGDVLIGALGIVVGAVVVLEAGR